MFVFIFNTVIRKKKNPHAISQQFRIFTKHPITHACIHVNAFRTSVKNQHNIQGLDDWRLQFLTQLLYMYFTCTYNSINRYMKKVC